MRQIYIDLFKSWDDVKRDFAMDELEPTEVLLAYYSYESYSGEAYVVYRKGDDYFVVTGAHCSCYGLEGKWEPEMYESKELLIGCLKLENFEFYKSDLQRAVGALIMELEHG